MNATPRRIDDIRLPPGHSDAELIAQIAAKSGLSADDVRAAGIRIVRKSVDARRKSAILLQYAVEVGPAILRPAGITRSLQFKVDRQPALRPVIVGAGPAGLFAALALAVAGCRPLLVEQGKPVDERQADVARFWLSGQLDPHSNVQFGEGGAGTFSDGKLTTGIKDPRCRQVLEEMVLAGAPEDILILARPHVGTDYLRTVVRRLREKIISLGGEIRFNCRLNALHHEQGRLTGMVCAERSPEGIEKLWEMPVSQLVLAIGHSARQTFSWLAEMPLVMEPKPFSLGVRIEHRQQFIDQCQYGSFARHPMLPPADYKLACHLPSGRSVYTFCMCPGGQVVAAASEAGGVVTNGMSHFARSADNANSALLVGIDPSDFPSDGPLGGMRWQQQIEQMAFQLAGARFRAPAERVGSFLGRRLDGVAGPDSPQPTYQPGVAWVNIENCLPSLVTDALRAALPELDRRLPGFAANDAVMTGPETRSSSPLRIIRDSSLQSSLAGLYPCGEGAGYAGGIMSAAVDGLRCAEAVISTL